MRHILRWEIEQHTGRAENSSLCPKKWLTEFLMDYIITIAIQQKQHVNNTAGN